MNEQNLAVHRLQQQRQDIRNLKLEWRSASNLI